MCYKIVVGLAICVFIVQVLTEQCFTPNNEEAKCISLYSCPILIGALASQQNSVIEFVRKSNCGGSSQNPMVCCGTSTNFTLDQGSYQNKSISKKSLLPSTSYCGLQHADDYYRATNDNSIRITEFPWSARIKYSSPEADVHIENEYLCIGSLINRRYVLTAAHCLLTRDYVPEAVQLGEYNVKNTTDCVREPPFEDECSEPTVELAVEKIILHPNYQGRKKLNDLGLIRLSKDVNFSDYVRPICLPFSEKTTAKIGDTLVSTGWGRRSFQEDYVEIKKKIFSQLLPNDECVEKVERYGRQVTENQLCGGTYTNSTSFECQGDSGGPLMFSYRNQWYQQGIISYGIGCGPDFPTIYTNVKKYLDWIIDVIEP